MPLPLVGAGPSASGGDTYRDKVVAYGPIAYWMLAETSGTTAACEINAAQNGTFARDVSTMGTGTGIGDGNSAPHFDGTSDYVDIFSAALAAAFNGSTGSLLAWGNVDVWVDGAWRSLVMLSTGGGANRLYMYKQNAGNLNYAYSSGGVLDYHAVVTAAPAWFCSLMTWNKPGDEVRYNLNGSYVANDTGLGVWAGSLAANNVCIGALNTTPAEAFDGHLSHVAIFDYVLSGPEIADLYVIPS